MRKRKLAMGWLVKMPDRKKGFFQYEATIQDETSNQWKNVCHTIPRHINEDMCSAEENKRAVNIFEIQSPDTLKL